LSPPLNANAAITMTNTTANTTSAAMSHRCAADIAPTPSSLPLAIAPVVSSLAWNTPRVPAPAAPAPVIAVGVSPVRSVASRVPAAAAASAVAAAPQLPHTTAPASSGSPHSPQYPYVDVNQAPRPRRAARGVASRNHTAPSEQCAMCFGVFVSHRTEGGVDCVDVRHGVHLRPAQTPASSGADRQICVVSSLGRRGATHDSRPHSGRRVLGRLRVQDLYAESNAITTNRDASRTSDQATTVVALFLIFAAERTHHRQELARSRAGTPRAAVLARR
jgi:hypothetical protein